MTEHPTTVPSGTESAAICTPADRITKSLLGYGVLAGPLYLGVSLAQALTRDGFDLSKHAWSLLANGDLGWIQIMNFVVAGLATVAAAVGLRRALGRRLAPTLIAAYGVSLVGAGIFRADPAQGFPAGTPETTPISWHGALHFVVGGVGFVCLIVACFVLTKRLRPAMREATTDQRARLGRLGFRPRSTVRK